MGVVYFFKNKCYNKSVMDEKELNKISNSIKEKLGDEAYARISDDMGTLITGNALNLDEIKKRDEQISKLKESNEQLISANGNLLKQVPMGSAASEASDDQEEDQKPKRFNYATAFDKSGHFIK